MPSIGHLAVGLASGRLRQAPVGVRPSLWTAAFVALAFLPDIDVLAFRLGIPYAAPFGHRGALHSLTFAAFCAALFGVLAWRLEFPPVPVIAIVGLVVASHGVLDAFTDGGLGIALLWPFSEERFFSPWRPIPVAPLGLRFLSARGVWVVLYECLLFLPLFVFGVWPRRGRARE